MQGVRAVEPQHRVALQREVRPRVAIAVVGVRHERVQPVVAAVQEHGDEVARSVARAREAPRGERKRSGGRRGAGKEATSIEALAVHA
jgi:hypothetical protein